MRRSLGVGLVAGVVFVSFYPHAASADGPIHQTRVLAVHDQSAYVASGGLHQFRLSPSGPVHIGSYETNGPARSVVLVTSDGAGRGGALQQGAAHSRLGVTGHHTLTVFAIGGTDEPVQTAVDFRPEQYYFRDAFSMGTEAMLSNAGFDDTVWSATDLSSPLRFEQIWGSHSRSLVVDWDVHRGRRVLAYNQQPLGGVSSGHIGILDPPDEQGRTRIGAERWVGAWAQGLVTSGDRAYVPVPRGDQIFYPEPNLVTLSLSDPALPILSHQPYVPVSTVVGDLALGLQDDLLVVSSLADPDRPVMVSSTRLAGYGVDVQPLPGDTTELGPADHALVVSETGGLLWLETFRLSGSGPPLRVRGPVFVPANAESGPLQPRLYMPRVELSERVGRAAVDRVPPPTKGSRS